MSTFFMLCAVLGGTILICQFVMTLLGLGGDHADGADVDGGELFEGTDSGASSPDGHDAGGHHGSTWLFSIISFRTLIAASTFFGLGGLLAESMNAHPIVQFAIALAFGFGAMMAVHKVMGLFHQLSEDGTVRIQRTVGLDGTVYVPIPANKTGAGKIHVSVQSRLMEYPAVTANGEKLPTGSKITVIDVIGSDTLEVAPARETAQTA